MSDENQTPMSTQDGEATPMGDPPIPAPPAGEEPTAEPVFSGDVADAAARHRRTMTGTVISTKMDKTAVVSVQRVFLHPKYRKYVRRRKHYMAHDEHGTCQLGDFVLIEECRPMSKHKHWRFKQTIRRKAG